MKTGAVVEQAYAATRLLLDSVSYSNPLPEWLDVLTIDYDARQSLIESRIAAYIDGRAVPKKPVRIAVPRRSGSGARTWVVPSVNDQIVLQACASALSKDVEARGAVDRERVYSYQLNAEPSRVAFTKGQLAAWKEFRQETEARVRGRQLLQIDLQQAFRNIDAGRFVEWFRRLAGDTPAVRLLSVLMRAFAHPSEGVPLINESISYLGNAYLSVVDEIVAGHADNFIRFVDDYHIFDSSRERLERTFTAIERDLNRVGMRTNPGKLRLGDEDDYLDAIRKVAPATREPTLNAEGYISAVVIDDMIDTVTLATMVAEALHNVDQIGEGMGRFLLQAVRRTAFNSILRPIPIDTYADKLGTLVRFPELASRAAALAADGEEWRLIWLLYVIEPLKQPPEFTRSIAALDPRSLSSVARAWMWRATCGDAAAVSIEALHDMSYDEAGEALYGP